MSSHNLLSDRPVFQQHIHHATLRLNGIANNFSVPGICNDEAALPIGLRDVWFVSPGGFCFSVYCLAMFVPAGGLLLV